MSSSDARSARHTGAGVARRTTADDAATCQLPTVDRDDVAMDAWTCRHLSLSNPIDDGASDLPRLLRRVADLVESQGIQAMELQDLTVSQTMTADGPWWSVTLYWAPDQPAQDAPRS